MDEATRALIELSAALGSRDAARLALALRRAAQAAPAAAVEEALLQSYLFLGYPAALNAIALWREQTGRPAPAATPDDWSEWVRRGEQVCARVYAGQYDRLRANVARLHPDLERWMVTEGYGKVLGRPGLPLALRELCIVALLAGLDAEPQLYSHLRGALHAGASAEQVEAALRIADEALVPERAAAARAVWAKVRWRREEPQDVR